MARLTRLKKLIAWQLCQLTVHRGYSQVGSIRTVLPHHRQTVTLLAGFTGTKIIEPMRCENSAVICSCFMGKADGIEKIDKHTKVTPV